jgi:hypothetical protein
MDLPPKDLELVVFDRREKVVINALSIYQLASLRIMAPTDRNVFCVLLSMMHRLIKLPFDAPLNMILKLKPPLIGNDNHLKHFNGRLHLLQARETSNKKGRRQASKERAIDRCKQRQPEVH